MKNYNLSLNQDLNRTFDLKGENTNDVADFIQPVKEIQPKINIVRSATRSATGATNLYTTPSDKDFYLQSVFLQWFKDVASDCTSAFLDISIEGIVTGRTLINFVAPTLTLYNDSAVITFPIPIKIDRNTNIRMSQTHTIGVSQISGSLTGYTQETTKGV